MSTEMLLETLGVFCLLGVVGAAAYTLGRQHADEILVDLSARSWRAAYIRGRKEGADFRRRFE